MSRLAPLHVDVYPAPRATRASITGEIDLATVPMLREALLALVNDPVPAVLDVDLTKVTFLDCAGVGALVSVRHAAATAGCQMWITHPQPIVRLVLKLTGLLSVFTAPATTSHGGDVPVAPSTTTDCVGSRSVDAPWRGP